MSELRLPDFDEPDVQIVYGLLCSNEMPPNPEEHWEGWLARRIVQELGIERVREQLVKAREALEPFGKFAAWVALEKPGWNHDEFYFDAPKEMPRFGAWRNALRILTDEEGTGK